MLLCEGRRQYGISTIAAQTSFGGETGDGVAKRRLKCFLPKTDL